MYVNLYQIQSLSTFLVAKKKHYWNDPEMLVVMEETEYYSGNLTHTTHVDTQDPLSLLSSELLEQFNFTGDYLYI